MTADSNGKKIMCSWPGSGDVQGRIAMALFVHNWFCNGWYTFWKHSWGDVPSLLNQYQREYVSNLGIMSTVSFLLLFMAHSLCKIYFKDKHGNWYSVDFCLTKMPCCFSALPRTHILPYCLSLLTKNLLNFASVIFSGGAIKLQTTFLVLCTLIDFCVCPVSYFLYKPPMNPQCLSSSTFFVDLEEVEAIFQWVLSNRKLCSQPLNSDFPLSRKVIVVSLKTNSVTCILYIF